MQYLALLRGVNVGGKNKLAMKDLTRLFIEAGCDEVRTYIQSGNVLFDADPAVAEQLPKLLTGQIADRFECRSPIVLRTAEELAESVRNNPFIAAGAAEDVLHLMFLADLPDTDCVASLDPHRSPPDEFIVQGREIYLRLPLGAGLSKLTNAYFDSRLKTISTVRNWRTVTKLLDLSHNMRK